MTEDAKPQDEPRSVPLHPFFTEAEFVGGLALVAEEDEALALARRLAAEADGDARVLEDTLILMSLSSPGMKTRVEEYYACFGLERDAAWHARRDALERELREEGTLE